MPEAHRSPARQIATSTGIVMAGILASRLLGFLREWAVAHTVGSNAATDAYYAAFTLPDFLNYLVAGGSLSLTFIPVLTKYLAEEREEEGWRVFSTVITFMGLLLVVLVVAGELYASRLVGLLAPGFAPAERQQVVLLTRLMLPAQICFYLGGILMAVQYARNQFVIPSLASVVYNSAIISAGLLLGPRLGPVGFALGVLAGALAGNFLLQLYGARRAGARYRPRLELAHPGFRLFLRLSVPIMLALSLSFTDDWILRWFGSYLPPASITWLSYAKTLMRVPLGFIGQAIGVAAFPVLTSLYASGRRAEATRLLEQTLEALLLLLVPIAALGMAESRPLVRVVFARTRLGPADFDQTAAALVWFLVGLAGWGAQNLLARGFYAMRDTLTPAVIGTAFTVLNLPVYGLLVRRWGHQGLALASSVGITAYALALLVLLARRTQVSLLGTLARLLLRLGVAAALAAAAAHAVVRLLEPRLGATAPAALAELVAATAAGTAVVLLAGRLLGLQALEMVLGELRRRVLSRLARSPANGPAS
jgi:putative peptidoglycan lipid II flippase